MNCPIFLNFLISEEPKIGKIKIQLHESGNSVTIEFDYDKNEIIKLIEKRKQQKTIE